jgi:hypothetical protein
MIDILAIPNSEFADDFINKGLKVNPPQSGAR